MSACIFDPLGFFSPSVLKAKLFMKKLWTKNLDWDEKLDDELLKEWLEISGVFRYISYLDVLE